MNDKRTFAFLALSLLVCGLLGPFLIRMWGSSELALGFGVVAEVLALIFGVLSYSEQISKTVTRLVAVLAILSISAIAILIPIRQKRSAELQLNDVKQITSEAMRTTPDSPPVTDESTLVP